MNKKSKVWESKEEFQSCENNPRYFFLVFIFIFMLHPHGCKFILGFGEISLGSPTIISCMHC